MSNLATLLLRELRNTNGPSAVNNPDPRGGWVGYAVPDNYPDPELVEPEYVEPPSLRSASEQKARAP